MNQPTIYLDVLILINLFVTYFLLLSTQKLLHIRSSYKRLIFSASIGGIYSLVILWENLPPILLNILKLFVAFVLVFISFGKNSFSKLFKYTLVFYIINFIYAGFMFAIWYLFAPVGMVYQNGVVYFHISAIILAGSTICAYLIIQALSFLLHKHVPQNQIIEVTIECDGKKVLVNAFIDTGNKLTDILTGLPVVICQFDQIKELFPTEIHTALTTCSLETIQNTIWQKRLRLLPISAVTGQSMIPAFHPPEFCLQNNIRKDVIIGITNQTISQDDFGAIISSDLVSQIS